MTRERTNALAAATLGAGIAANAVLGPLGFGVIRIRESANMETQLLGGELTALFLAAPLAWAAAVLWLKGRRIAPVVGVGPAGFSLYTYVQYVLVPDYTRYPGNGERFFPLYLALIMLGGFLVLRSWRELSEGGVARVTPRLAAGSGALLVVLNAAFGIAWIASVASILAHGPTVEYLEHPTAFWLIRLMDLGFVIPLGITTGVGLLGRSEWAARNLHAFIGTQTLLACAVAGMALRMRFAHDPGASVVMLAISCSAAAVLAVLFVALIVNAAHPRDTAGDSPATNVIPRDAPAAPTSPRATAYRA